MAALVNVGLSKQLDALNEVIVSADGNTDNLQKAVLNIIVKNMINQKSSNTDLLYSLISKDILEEARKGNIMGKEVRNALNKQSEGDNPL